MRLPQGFKCSGVHCGLKSYGEFDLGMLVSEHDCSGAAVFTQNQVVAAPVVLGRELMEAEVPLRAVMINSKNANAVTGEQGLKDAREMAALGAEVLELPRGRGVFVMSTGVIGEPLPMHCLRRGIPEAAKLLRHGTGDAFSRSMMTTDTHPKTASARVDGVSVVGFAKGSGMIHPNMATMLATVVTDADLESDVLQPILSRVNEKTFNCISVDGDTSTNDTVLVMANGAAGKVEPDRFEQALMQVLTSLARQIAFDGEGASHQVTVMVEGATSFEEARQVGRTIATSPLVKTAVFGRDANWGRILAAAGRSGVEFEIDKVQLWIQNHQYLKDGAPVKVDPDLASESLSHRGVLIRLHLGQGNGQAEVWTCDLTPDYISVNADYRT